MRSSGAVQLRDLSLALLALGHEVTVMVASPELDQPWHLDVWNGVQVMRLKTPQTKDVGYVRRTLGEWMMPHSMKRNLHRSPLGKQRWDGVVWYSPTIFLGPAVQMLKKASTCRAYLIIRDIFPEWAVDMGLMGKGLPYLFFKAIARHQYSVADVIGVQSPGNLAYFTDLGDRPTARVEVLQNWLADAPDKGCSITVSQTPLAGRKIFVYAGNMGIAQGMDALIDLAGHLVHRSDLGFLFVGRGSESRRLQGAARDRQLSNVLFFDEIDPDEIPGLYAQCHVGLIALDPRHKTHNIPGKFLTYMQSGLPVLACINQGNDLIKLIMNEQVGRVTANETQGSLQREAEGLVRDIEGDPGIGQRCRALFRRLFAPETAAKQVVQGLQNRSGSEAAAPTPA
ncbi:MAG: glycosyltransferase family 4 protein [Ramlibacter sp.]|nr:glycosyltransferase family 4 protein [Ramlibacter sp.]